MRLRTCLPLLLCLVACRTPAFRPEQGTRVLAQVGQRVTQEAYADRVDFRTWPEVEGRHRSALEAAKDPEAFAKVVNQALGTYKVSHLRLLTPEATRLKERNRLAATLGFMASLQQGRWVVMRVLLDGPAWRAGLRGGDVLDLSADKTLAEAFKGKGAQHLAWFREGARMETTLTREVVPMESGPSLTWVRQDVACLRVPSFRKGLYDRDRAQDLLGKAAGASALVLDLRSNGGGLLDHVGHLLSQLLPAGTALYAPVGRREAQTPGAAGLSAPDLAKRLGRWVRARPAGGSPFAGRVLVLVDPFNGSGGELCPAILQDLGRGEVVGLKTPGAVLGSQDRALEAGWSLQLPVLEVVTVGGRSLEGKGVVPDHVVAPEVLARDASLFPELLRILDAPTTARTPGRS